MIEQVTVGAMDPRRFSYVLTATDYEQFVEMIERATPRLRGRVVWNVNSTAKGGGVVELLRPLLGYARGSGIDARWVVISGDPQFFTVTKRLHNHLHGFEGDGGPLAEPEHAAYERTLAANAAELVPLVKEQDIVILHDPQTAGLVEPIRAAGATVIWRCHVGLDDPNDLAREAWAFLRGYVEPAEAYVFSREAFAWEGLDSGRIAVIQPSIDAFSPKNADQTPEQALAILARAGIQPHRTSAEPTFVRTDGTPGRVDRQAEMVQDEPLSAEHRLITQVSRWDRLKDPLGVLEGFAGHVADDQPDAHLLLAGPSTEAVADDPEGAGVFAAMREARSALPEATRRRVHFASLPMDDTEENAAMVNALQRRSDIIVQKSLAEGFGLTVAEAMWKERPVVASRIGGIQDQIVDGESGRLISDPNDLREFGAAVDALLADPEAARRIGTAARARVRERFLGPHHLGRYFVLIQRLLGGERSQEDSSPQAVSR